MLFVGRRWTSICFILGQGELSRIINISSPFVNSLCLVIKSKHGNSLSPFKEFNGQNHVLISPYLGVVVTTSRRLCPSTYIVGPVLPLVSLSVLAT